MANSKRVSASARSRNMGVITTAPSRRLPGTIPAAQYPLGVDRVYVPIQTDDYERIMEYISIKGGRFIDFLDEAISNYLFDTILPRAEIHLRELDKKDRNAKRKENRAEKRKINAYIAFLERYEAAPDTR
jgi:hypothetical protein